MQKLKQQLAAAQAQLKRSADPVQPVEEEISGDDKAKQRLCELAELLKTVGSSEDAHMLRAKATGTGRAQE